LAALLAAAATGASGDLEAGALEVRRLGVPEPALREALLLVVPYAGYPRALSAFARVRPAVVDAASGAEPSAAERAQRGVLAFEAVYGATAPRVLDGLARLDPLLPAWTLEHAYGRVIARPGLQLVDRELLAVAMLAALGSLGDPLLGHMRGALRLGAGAADLARVLDALPPHVDAARRQDAKALLSRI
jgi:alkylhydroperoxidase/carboxymuconolactone decarboxylase family protein YurZ